MSDVRACVITEILSTWSSSDKIRGTCGSLSSIGEKKGDDNMSRTCAALLKIGTRGERDFESDSSQKLA